MNQMMTTSPNFILRNTVFISVLLYICAWMFSCQREEKLELHAIQLTNGWGYVITSQHKTIIRQQVIPVIAENKSFASEDDALKVGQNVLSKIKQNLSPTITLQELETLKIRY